MNESSTYASLTALGPVWVSVEFDSPFYLGSKLLISPPFYATVMFFPSGLHLIAVHELLKDEKQIVDF